MCGICGIWNFDSNHPADPRLLERMTQRIRHRGPDEGGIHVDGSVGLGFRRLSILDVATSHQPMANEDRSVWIVYNGEVYNFQELRRALIGRHRFRTSGDTETVLHNYVEHGPDGVRRLRGMYAFAIWDGPRQRMTLTVDRFGKKPLYYSLNNQRLVFGSELKVLRELSDLSLEVDPHALDEYLANGFIGAPRSIFRSVRKVPPGHFLTVEASGQAELHRYWQPKLQAESAWRSEPPAELAKQLRAELETAVRLRLMSEVPLGAFLSGGLDSSAVVALMSRMTSHRVKTFSIGFADDPNDETPFSALMARHVNSDHTHEVVTAAQLADVAPSLAAHFDEPFADDSMVPTWFVSKVARRAVTVALSGDGGDEVFGGYTWYRRAWRQARLEAATPTALRPLAKALGSKLPAKYAAYFAGLDAPPAAWRSRSPYFDTAGRQALYRSETRSALRGFDADSARSSILASAAELPLLSQLQTLDLAGYLPGDILVKVDRVSMKESLEVRCPLLDQAVFEFMSAVPPELKLNARGSKWLFQQAVADLLPPAIWQRQKRGFDVPLATWFAGPLRPLVTELRESPSLKLHEWLQPAAVRSVLFKADSSSPGDAGRVWALICLELWARSGS